MSEWTGTFRDSRQFNPIGAQVWVLNKVKQVLPRANYAHLANSHIGYINTDMHIDRRTEEGTFRDAFPFKNQVRKTCNCEPCWSYDGLARKWIRDKSAAFGQPFFGLLTAGLLRIHKKSEGGSKGDAKETVQPPSLLSFKIFGIRRSH